MSTKLRRLAAASAIALACGAGPAAAQDLTIATSMPNLAFPFFVHMEKELAAEAEELGGITLIQTDGQGSSPKQTSDVEAAIIQGVDGIIISPNEVDAMAPALKQAVDAGIPVVTIDRRVDNVDGILAHVGADNVRGGEAQGEWVMKTFPEGARVFNLQGQPGASPAIDRNQGLHNVLDGDDKYAFAFEQTANFARDRGAAVTEAGLQGMDQPPDVIVAANDDMALGALVALQSLGMDIPVIGFDALPEALASIQAGELDATIEQMPGGQSRQAMRILVDHLRGGKEPEEAVVLLEPFVVTAENIDEAERLGEVQ